VAACDLCGVSAFGKIALISAQLIFCPAERCASPRFADESHVRTAPMRIRSRVVTATIFFSLSLSLAACSSEPETGANAGTGGASGAAGGRGGSTPVGGASGGSAGTASGGQPGASGGGNGSGGSGGSASSGGTSGGLPDAAAGGSAGAAADAAIVDAPSELTDGAVSGGGTALVVVGPQIIGTDNDIIAQLKAHGLKVETVVEAMATPADAVGKSLVVLSYSLDSDNFKADYSMVTAPIILMERGLLARLGMTSSDKWAEPVTALTIVAGDSPLAAGLPAGDHVVYSKPGEFFWGMPSAEAIKVATVKGNPNQWVIFAYPAGAMMVGKKAAGKRLHFFFGSHLVPDTYLNDTGKKLLGAAIDWSIQ
jgi:hypothetical protein